MEGLVLKNDYLLVEMDKPGSVYQGSRFDWTGFIRQITFNKVTFCTTETGKDDNLANLGAGLCNEFGIVRPVGYQNCPVNELFPKIGVGQLIRQSTDPYRFFHAYPIVPANLVIQEKLPGSVTFISKTPVTRGYGYELKKTILICENQLKIQYQLENIGTEPISTNEYCHNFIAINHLGVTPAMELQLPFKIEPAFFGETVNPEDAVIIGENSFKWAKTPSKPFFFSNVGKPTEADYQWKLTHSQLGVSVSEKVTPTSAEMNLWGIGHVISPELFVEVTVKPGGVFEWQRVYTFTQMP